MAEMSDAKRELDRLRAEIDAADNALADALDARASAVGELKALREQHPDLYFQLPRAVDVAARLRERVKQFPADAIGAVVREALGASQHLLAPIAVAYLGQEGGFGHLAARTHFGSSASMQAHETSQDVLSAVERGNASYGVLPFETSYDGAVTETVNLLARGEAKVCAEIPVRRTFHLMSATGRSGTNFRTIYASASAITACQSFLSRRFPGALVIDTRTGLMAAQRARDEADAAALCTEAVAELTGLEVLERSIEDIQDLETRYVAVGNDFPARTGTDRTAIALALHDAPGVLMECLQPFAERGINLNRLETRPARGWEFRYLILFVVDGHITDRPMLAAIEQLRASSRYVKVLGSYPSVPGA
jgi:chorismate mutase/prephenate dehydratase